MAQTRAPDYPRAMNLDQIEGVAKILAGKAQQRVGDLLDDPELFVRGIRQQVAGARQKGFGDAREFIREHKRKLH
jgi:uncharacterized protein YjbJ (UPF0337 family)